MTTLRELPHFEMPRLRTLARHAVPHVLEGTVVPLALFLLMLRFIGVWGAVLMGLGWTYVAVARRLVTGRRVPGVLLLAAVTLTARTVIAIVSGSVVVYFLQPTLGTALIAGAFLLSVPLGRPLAERLARDFCPIPTPVLMHERVRQFFLRITLLWAFTQLANASLTLWQRVFSLSTRASACDRSQISCGARFSEARSLLTRSATSAAASSRSRWSSSSAVMSSFPCHQR
jgi:hypothetical protein